MIKKCCGLHGLAWALVIIGGLNWGLVGLGGLFGGGDWNVISALLGGWPVVEGVVYLLVGLSAIAMLTMGRCKQCQAKGM